MSDNPDVIAVESVLDFAVFVTRLKRRMQGYRVDLLRCWYDKVFNSYMCEMAINGFRCGFQVPKKRLASIAELMNDLIQLYEYHTLPE